MREEQEEIFGRDQEIGLVKQGLDIKEDEDIKVYVFHGVSGVGKSTLWSFSRTLKEVERHFCISVEVMKNEGNMYTEDRTVRFLYHRLRNLEFKFPRYELVCTYLYEQEGMMEYHIDHLISGIETLVQDMIKIPFSILNLDNELTLFCDLKKIFTEQSQKKVFSELMNDIKVSSLQSLKGKLTDLFIQDYNDNIDSLISHNSRRPKKDQQKVVIFLDSFEMRSCKDLYPMEDWFIEKLIPNMKKTTWFIYTTENDFPIIESKVVEVVRHEVKKFSEDTMLEYLKREIPNQEICLNIAKVSDGLPACMQILLRLYKENNQWDSKWEKKGYEELFKEYFEKHLGEEKHLFISMATFQYWNYEMVKAVCGECGQPDEKYSILQKETALVVRREKDGETVYRHIDIVRKTILALFHERPELRTGYKGKFNYYKEQTDKWFDKFFQTDHNITQKDYMQFEEDMEGAFDGATHAYSDKTEYMEYISWCINSERKLSKLGLFDFKLYVLKKLTADIKDRDGFKYEKKDTDIRFKIYQDTIWSYRMTGNWEKTLHEARKYRRNMKKQYSRADKSLDEHIPYTTYILGLTYRDNCKIQKAEDFFKLSIKEAKKLGEDIELPPNNLLIIPLVYNVLGCMYTDEGKYIEAEKCFMYSLNYYGYATRKSIIYGNLAKLHFVWIRNEWKNIEETNRHLEICKKYLEEAKREIGKSIIDRCSLEIRELTLGFTKNILEKYEQNSYFNERKKLCEEYRKRLQDLQNDLLRGNQKKSVMPLILCCENNISVTFAIEEKYEESRIRLAGCLEKKIAHYRLPENLQLSRPTILETEYNIKAVDARIIRTDEKADYILQF